MSAPVSSDVSGETTPEEARTGHIWCFLIGHPAPSGAPPDPLLSAASLIFLRHKSKVHPVVARIESTFLREHCKTPCGLVFTQDSYIISHHLPSGPLHSGTVLQKALNSDATRPLHKFFLSLGCASPCLLIYLTPTNGWTSCLSRHYFFQEDFLHLHWISYTTFPLCPELLSSQYVSLHIIIACLFACISHL